MFPLLVWPFRDSRNTRDKFSQLSQATLTSMWVLKFPNRTPAIANKRSNLKYLERPLSTLIRSLGCLFHFPAQIIVYCVIEERGIMRSTWNVLVSIDSNAQTVWTSKARKRNISRLQIRRAIFTRETSNVCSVFDGSALVYSHEYKFKKGNHLVLLNHNSSINFLNIDF